MTVDEKIKAISGVAPSGTFVRPHESGIMIGREDKLACFLSPEFLGSDDYLDRAIVCFRQIDLAIEHHEKYGTEASSGS